MCTEALIRDDDVFDVDLVSGVEGQCLLLNDYRICGPKAWGGGTVDKKWKLSGRSLIAALKGASHVESEAKVSKPAKRRKPSSGFEHIDWSAIHERTFVGESGDYSNPKRGFSAWVEWGKWYAAPTVDRSLFGGHAYDGHGYDNGIRECPCGCYMGDSSSGGPVDPFGPCPMNPRKKPVSKTSKNKGEKRCTTRAR